MPPKSPSTPLLTATCDEMITGWKETGPYQASVTKRVYPPFSVQQQPDTSGLLNLLPWLWSFTPTVSEQTFRSISLLLHVLTPTHLKLLRVQEEAKTGLVFIQLLT